MKLDESIFDEIASEPTFAPIETIGIETANSQLPETDDDRGVAHLLLNAISNTTDSISMFNDIIANTDSEGIISIINEILLDENRHLGLLQSALEVVSPNANAIDDGSSLGDDLVQNEINESIDEKFIGGPHEAHYKNYIIKRDITDSFWEIENNGGDVIADNFDSVVDAKAFLDENEVNESLNEEFEIDDDFIDSMKNVLAVYVVDDAENSPVIYEEDFDISENVISEETVNVSPTMVNAILSALQGCNSIFVEPTPKNREFMRKYGMSQDDYKSIFNQIKSSDFNKAIHSTYPKYKDDLLFVFHSEDVQLNNQSANLAVYIKVNVSKSDKDSVIAISFHELNQFESLGEDIHDKFKRDIKNSYKSWVNNQERIEQRRNDMLDLLGDMDDVSDETKEKWTRKTKELYPDVEYSYSFPRNIEKDDYPFYVTYYAEYPIYEPAEGGYYYAGRDAVWSEGFNSREEAEAYAKRYVDQDMDNWEQSQNGYEIPGQYIGQTQSIRIEDNKSYLSDIAEPHPYE